MQSSGMLLMHCEGLQRRGRVKSRVVGAAVPMTLCTHIGQVELSRRVVVVVDGDVTHSSCNSSSRELQCNGMMNVHVLLFTGVALRRFVWHLDVKL
jgi:hypothetical protein